MVEKKLRRADILLSPNLVLAVLVRAIRLARNSLQACLYIVRGSRLVLESWPAELSLMRTKAQALL